MNQQEYVDFEEKAFRQLTKLNERLETSFKLGSYERFDLDQETGEFVFSDGGIPKVLAQFQIVGSTSSKASTWLWSWANPSILERVSARMHRVRAFGVEHEISRLKEDKWTADEGDGWAMAAVAVALLDAKGAYRCPTKSGHLFVIFTDIDFVAN